VINDVALVIEQLDHREPAIAAELGRVMRRAYVLEAEWLNLAAGDFPPAQRSDAAIAAASGPFFGLRASGKLVAVLELEETTEGSGPELWIASLCVDPAFHRQGHGRRLVKHAIQVAGGRPLRVSTGAANAAAMALYESQGFRVNERRTLPDGLVLVRLVRER